MKHTQLARNVLIAMLLGFSLGLVLYFIPETQYPWVNAYITQGVLAIGSMLFITSIKLLVVPLIAVSLMYAMTRLDLTHVGRLSFKTLSLYLLTSVLAIVLAIFFASVFQLGHGLEMSEQVFAPQKSGAMIGQFFADLIPKPILDVIMGRKLIALIIVSLIVGYALHFMGQLGKQLTHGVEKLNAGILRLLTILIYLTPVGVFCLTAQSFAYFGLEMVGVLLKYMLVMIFVLCVHVGITSTILLRWMSGLNIKTFFKKMSTAMLVAFSTTSSNVALPVSLDTVENKLGVSKPIASFAMPMGATLNMDGGAVLQGMATIFIANYYGIDFSLIDYGMIVIAALIATVGTAGVPSVGPVMLVFVLQWMGLPLEGIGLILGVDKFLEMFRTTVNITGDAMVACAVASSENALDRKIYNAP
ncbi:MAG: dicarboxylate/amino acid:cation symporter [Legionellales bacterium]|jgi:Na+/H+-dicarboxylate symporter